MSYIACWYEMVMTFDPLRQWHLKPAELDDRHGQ